MAANCSIRQAVNAIDIDNATDYKEMVKKILDEKLFMVKILVDM